MAQFEEDSEKIQVHLIEGYRTVIVDSSVKFLQGICSIKIILSLKISKNMLSEILNSKSDRLNYGTSIVPICRE